MKHPSKHNSSRRGRRAVTLVELLVVVALVVVLITLLIVALAAASTYAASARTSALMTSMSQGMDQLETDFGALPPLLDHDRNYFAPPDPASGSFGNDLQTWFSVTSPAEYLLGYGGAAADGADGLGLRHPGRDGLWGALQPGYNGLLAERQPNISGKVLGPYLTLEDEQLIGSWQFDNGLGRYRAYLPTEGGYDSAAPKVILDYWGQPIWYYLDHPDREVNLGDVFVLRPFSIEPDREARSQLADASGDTATSFSLKGASFAFYSTGPDRTSNIFLRYDDPDDPQNTAGTAFANEDNLVEVGK